MIPQPRREPSLLVRVISAACGSALHSRVLTTPQRTKVRTLYRGEHAYFWISVDDGSSNGTAHCLSPPTTGFTPRDMTSRSARRGSADSPLQATYVEPRPDRGFDWTPPAWPTDKPVDSPSRYRSTLAPNFRLRSTRIPLSPTASLGRSYWRRSCDNRPDLHFTLSYTTNNARNRAARSRICAA